jgi:hypothetical protein
MQLSYSLIVSHMKKIVLVIIVLFIALNNGFAATYYYKGGVVTLTSSWTTNSSGTGGSSPVLSGGTWGRNHSFVFNATNIPTLNPTLTGTLPLGTGCTIVINANITLTIASTANVTNSPRFSFTNNNAGLEIANASFSNYTFVSTNLSATNTRVIFSATSPQMIKNIQYANLIISNSVKTLQGNVTVWKGLSLLNNGVLSIAGFGLTVRCPITYAGTGSIAGSSLSNLTFLTSSNTLRMSQANDSDRSLNNLTVSASLTLDNNNSLNLYGTLTVNTSAVFNAPVSGGELILKSSASQQARIGSLSNGTVNGNNNIRIERYIQSAGTRLYWEIASPITTPVSSWQNGGSVTNGIYVTGTFSGSSVIPGVSSSTASMFILDANAALWSKYPVSSNSELLNAGVGYRTFIRDCGSGCTTTSNKTISAKGNINQGNFTFNLGWNATGFPGFSTTLPVGGWNLLGNPYPSSINANLSSGWNRTNIDATVYVYDHDTKQYLASTNGVGQFSTIAQGQAFWVRISSGFTTGVLRVRESAKQIDNGYELLRTTNINDNLLSITLSNENTKSNALVKLSEFATESFDSEMDALNINNEGNGSKAFVTSLLNKSDNTQMIINALPIPTSVDTIPLYVNSTAGNSVITIDSVQNLSAVTDVYLYDAFTGEKQDLRKNNTYTFSVDKTNTATFGGARFSLIMDNTAIQIPTSTTSTMESNAVQVYPNPVENKTFTLTTTSSNADVVILNASGQEVYTTSLTGMNNQVNLPSQLAVGVYVLKVKQAEKTTTTKLLVK